MPEALRIVPALKISIGTSSETETSTTDRSHDAATTSASSSNLVHNANSAIIDASKENNNNNEKPLPSTDNAPKRKSRRSNVRRNQKKTLLKTSSQQKIASTTHQQKSQIPRALLLTPSTSSASLTTNNSPSPRHSPIKPTAPPKQLQRQNTISIIKFRARKSISQMDLKHARRNGSYAMPAGPACMLRDCPDKSGSSLMPKCCTDMLRSSQTSLMGKLMEQENYYFVVSKPESKVAGMKIFATIMLNAWRKRRDEVKRLSQEINDLKRGSIKAKNQLHVYNSLFRVEQRRNDELNCQLKRSMDDISHAKSSCESLTTSLISMKADKELLQQELHLREQETDGLNAMLMQTKSDLFKAMTQQRELQATLSTEQRKVQMLENQKNDLINEICELNNDSKQKTELLRLELKTKDVELAKAEAEISKFEELVLQLQGKDVLLREYAENELKLKKDVESLECEMKGMRQCLDATLDRRLKTCWQHTVACHRVTFQIIHWFAFYVLPATPPPKFNKLPFCLTLEKALGIVKR